jgi:DNA-directed RNA polymerase subunit RPC12/RpoP
VCGGFGGEGMKWVFDDGGRKDSGYKGHTGDCVTRAISIVTGKSYKEVYDNLNLLGKAERTTKRRHKKSNSRTGVYKKTYDDYLKSLGFEWVPTMFIGSGCKVHLKKSELPSGKLVAKLSEHITAVIDGVIHDTYDCSRNETRCVYGYFIKKTETPTIICAWCGKIIKKGSEVQSHTACDECKKKIMEEEE